MRRPGADDSPRQGRRGSFFGLNVHLIVRFSPKNAAKRARSMLVLTF